MNRVAHALIMFGFFIANGLPPLDSRQLFEVNKAPDGSPLVQNKENKYNIPNGASASAQRLQLSITRSIVHLNHPTGAQLFPGNGGLAKQLDQFLACVEPMSTVQAQDRFKLGKDNYFCVYFTRLQITILTELYQHLLAVYTNLLLTPAPTMHDYVQLEAQYGLNNKILIVGHLLNVIEEQSNQSVQMRFPHLPQYVSTRMGPLLLRNDFGANLYTLVESDDLITLNSANDKEFYKNRRTLYNTIFSKYLAFFNAYTKTIEQPDAEFGSVCARYARGIKEQLDKKAIKGSTHTNAKAVTQAIDATKTKTINPPLFLYGSETIRALAIVGPIARNIPEKSALVPWPERVVSDAVKSTPLKNNNGEVISNLTRAYLVDKQGSRTTTQQGATQLFVHIPAYPVPYAQEIKKQPQWLNSYEGVMLMMRACLGDYSVLCDPLLMRESILDPCSACIVMSAAATAGIPIDAVQTKCTECINYLKTIKGTPPPVPQTEQPATGSSAGELPLWTPDLPPMTT
ncbi:MAG: hypothetical protein WCE21_01795 [Candidatus Babeliales bacterium]